MKTLMACRAYRGRTRPQRKVNSMQIETCQACDVSREDKSTTWCQRWSDSNMKLFQYEDTEIGRVIKWIQEGKRSSREEITDMGPTMGKLWNKFSALSLVDGILYGNFEDEKGETTHLQLCLPRKLVKEAPESTHDNPSAGHLASQRMAEVIKKRFYWSAWGSDVEAYCRNCQKCAERNHPSKKVRGHWYLNIQDNQWNGSPLM